QGRGSVDLDPPLRLLKGFPPPRTQADDVSANRMDCRTGPC
ncbi:MAG: hypothetical protein QOC90_1774, partial [Mycobacterium sp.]|nr:hypothetical protein [Mycobacterium sp.]